MNISKIGSKASHHFSTIHTLRATSLLNVVECNLIMFTSTPVVHFPWTQSRCALIRYMYCTCLTGNLESYVVCMYSILELHRRDLTLLL